MERRRFLIDSAFTFGSLPLINSNDFDFLNIASAEIARTRIGKISCTIFQDLMFKYLAKDFFINANPGELDKALAKYKTKPDNIPSPFIPILVQQGDKTILIDTGVGYSEKPVEVKGNSVVFHGKLQQLLHEEKITNEDITDVIVTHFHPDHIGGIFSDAGKLNFPNARFHLHEDEWNYWHSPRSDNQPEQFKYFIGKNITPLKNLNLNLIKGDFIELLPGITTVKADGHTPGQIGVIMHSEKEHLMYISDAFLHPLHIENLDWQTNYDMDHEKARQARIKIIELATKDSMLVSAFHFDFPGLGRIDKLAGNWTWKYSEK